MPLAPFTMGGHLDAASMRITVLTASEPMERLW